MNTKDIIDDITDALEEVVETVEQAAITTVMTVLGHGDYFYRVVAHVKRIEAEMPEPKSGREKRAKFFREFWIVLNDILFALVIPFGESVMRQLLEMALAYIDAGAASHAKPA